MLPVHHSSKGQNIIIIPFYRQFYDLDLDSYWEFGLALSNSVNPLVKVSRIQKFLISMFDNNT